MVPEKLNIRGPMAIKHLSTQEIDKLIVQEPDITIRGYLDMLEEIHRIGISRLPEEVVEQQRFRRKGNRIRNQVKEKV